MSQELWDTGIQLANKNWELLNQKLKLEKEIDAINFKLRWSDSTVLAGFVLRDVELRMTMSKEEKALRDE